MTDPAEGLEPPPPDDDYEIPPMQPKVVRKWVGVSQERYDEFLALTTQVEKLQRERIEIVNRVMARERELSHFYDELGEPDLDSAVACIRSLFAAEAELARLRPVVDQVAARHRRTTYLKPPYECQCGEIRCSYLAALDAPGGPA